MLAFLIRDTRPVTGGGTVATGLRVRRVVPPRPAGEPDDEADKLVWLDPADPTGRTWVEAPPVALWPGAQLQQPYGPGAAGTPLQGAEALIGHTVVFIPEDGMPDEATLVIISAIKPGQAGPGLDSTSARGSTEWPYLAKYRRDRPLELEATFIPPGLLIGERKR